MFFLLLTIQKIKTYTLGKIKIENNELFDDDDNTLPTKRSSNNNDNKYNYKSNEYNLADLVNDDKIVVEAAVSDGKPSSRDSDDDAAAKAAEDKIKTIAFNSREYRLVGPQQKEVEMKDDVGTKMMIALENLSKEATDVWDQVNTKLDKGWTEFKAMVEGALNNNNNNKKASYP